MVDSHVKEGTDSWNGSWEKLGDSAVGEKIVGWKLGDEGVGDGSWELGDSGVVGDKIEKWRYMVGDGREYPPL